MAINPKILKWFNGRGISVGTVESMGIVSGTRRGSGEGFRVVPDPKGDVICFPYVVNRQAVNVKFRDLDKKAFSQKVGGEKVFYNSQVLDDEQLIDGRAALVIVEGEMDLLSLLEAGYPFVVSVPDGAPPALNGPSDTADFDPAHDTKYSYIARHWEQLKKIKRIVIATDADGPGQRLASELVRRLGRARCSFVEYPEGCKDMNEVLNKCGMATIHQILNSAKPYPVSGVYTYTELPEEPPIETLKIGLGTLDDYLKPFFPSLMVVTGFPGSGKSVFVNNLVARMALENKCNIAIASFEMIINPFVTRALENVYRAKHGNKGIREWMNDTFCFIAPEPSEDGDSYDIEWLIDRMITAVVRYGTRIVVIDPWNEIEHALNRGESLTEYTGRAIRALKRFAREFGVMVIVVAHPTKSAAAKAPWEVSLYDISDSAHFNNKADFGLVVSRYGGMRDNKTVVTVKKVRYQPQSGQLGCVIGDFDINTWTFSPFMDYMPEEEPRKDGHKP